MPIALLNAALRSTTDYDSSIFDWLGDAAKDVQSEEVAFFSEVASSL